MVLRIKEGLSQVLLHLFDKNPVLYVFQISVHALFG